MFDAQPDGGQNCYLILTYLDWNGAGWSGQYGPLQVTVNCGEDGPSGGFSFKDGECAFGGSVVWSFCTGGLICVMIIDPPGLVDNCCNSPPGTILYSSVQVAEASNHTTALPFVRYTPPPPTCECDCAGANDFNMGGGTVPADAGPAAGGPDAGAGQDDGMSSNPIRYADGSISLRASDISSSGFGVRWGHTRSFASRMSHSESAGNGFNWQVQEWPYVVTQYDGAVAVLGRQNTAVYFDKIEDSYVAQFGIKTTLSLDLATNKYLYTEQNGTVTTFDRFTGGFRKRTDAAGTTIEVTAMTGGTNFSQVQRSYTEGASSAIERYQYAYGTDTGDYLLSTVTLSRSIDGGAFGSVAKATYTYYPSGAEYGYEGDLETVTTQLWQDSQWKNTGTTYYRYYLQIPTSSSSSSSSSSSPIPQAPAHLLKFVVNPTSFERLAADPNVTDPLTASNAIVALYADYYYEYDSQRRVIREMVQGGSRSFSFDFHESSNTDGFNSWKFKTIETQPDSSQLVVYSNFAGQTMLKVHRNGDDQWCDFWKYDDEAHLMWHAKPSAVLGFDEQYADLLHAIDGQYQYLHDSAGLIESFTYHAPTGFVASSSIQQGQQGDSIKLREYEYCCIASDCGCEGGSSSSSSASSSSCASGVWLLKRGIVYPSDTDQTKKIVTSYCYSFHSGTTRVQQKTIILPAIPAEQNGSGIAATRKEYFDTYNNLIWKMDERGYITRMKYDIPTGALTQLINDVDTSVETDAPFGWVTPADGGLNLITDFEHDQYGRMIQSLGPTHTIDLNGMATTIRRAFWIVYLDTDFQMWSGQGYASGAGPTYSYALINPISITKVDASGKVLEKISAARTSTFGKLEPTDNFSQSDYVRWTTNQYTDCCFAASQRIYHTIPASGSGSPGTNYDETDYGYDIMKRQNRNVTPGGTITYRVFDTRGNSAATYIGTNDSGATDEDPTGGGALGNNMVLVVENEYDNGVDGGDGNMTSQARYVDAMTKRVTQYLYDWRDRQIAVDGEIDFYQQMVYDNLDRVLRTDRRDTTSSGHIVGRSETKYDDQSRVFRAIRYAVNPTTGAIGNSLTDNTWFDASGNVIKSKPAGSQIFIKTVYDSLGRATVNYSGYDLNETDYDGAGNVDDDVILEQSETTYDTASNEIQSTQRQRYHNAPSTQTGPLQDPSSDPKARVSYSATWPDGVSRRQASANYGTNVGVALSRPSTIPARSDAVLVSSTNYDLAGNLLQTTDPSGMVTRMAYDAVGRQIAQILNYQPNSSSSSSSSSSGDDCPSSTDINVTVLTSYNADGNISTLTAVNASTGNQVIQYVYGTSLSDSGLATSILKRQEIYPDSVDEGDVIRFAYNRQRQVTQVTDQGGTVHQYDFDLLGRQTQDRITALGTDVDSAILRIETTFEVRGMKCHLTSYDNASVSSGAVVNDCQYVYNDFGQLITEYQSHGGLVNADTTPKVQYVFADGSSNTARQTQLIYPDGRELNYDFGEVDGIDDAASRVASLIDDDGTTYLVDYAYLGDRTFVVTDYSEPETRYTLVGTAGGDDPDTGDIYRGLDRFGRIKDSYWYDYGDSSDADRIKYGYDRVGNRLWRENVVANANGAAFDELYHYDQVHRLEHMDRGTLSSLHTTISSSTFAQCWTLDETGNWKGFREDDTGDGTWSMMQSRTANPANEITNITNVTGASWASPGYSRVGNMTTVPQPTAPTTSYVAAYDAWNRLVELVDTVTSHLVASYQYDGARRRIVQKTYTNGTLDETRNYYHTRQNCMSTWQIVEERLGADPDLADPVGQFVWGSRYVDDCILLDRDSGGGMLGERLYALQDANWNVTGLVSASGAIEERMAYTAYGVPEFLSPLWVSQADEFEWGILYAGYLYEIKTGLAHVRNRVLHPKLGCWTRRDPLGAVEGSNLYQYCESNPYLYLDATGLAIPIAGALPLCAAGPPGVATCIIVGGVLIGAFIFYFVVAVKGTCAIYATSDTTRDEFHCCRYDCDMFTKELTRKREVPCASSLMTTDNNVPPDEPAVLVICHLTLDYPGPCGYSNVPD
ncbi:MAG: RHS repeat-associated core domain-containing protein [Planctomycetota bacterium]